MANHNTRFFFDEQSQENAKIKVVGVGGGGGNAINNMLEKLREQKIRWNETDQAAKKEDKVTIDYKGTINEEEFSGGSQNNFSVVLLILLQVQ